VRPLDSLRPFLISANVRGDLDNSQYYVASGLGQVGDLILGRVMPRSGQQIVILDQSRTAHTITKSQRVLAVLGPRDSSTHVCATIPTGGLQVNEDTAVHWVAGESGIVGCLEREPPLNSVHTAESSVEFLCDGLILDSKRRPVSIREFAVKPRNGSVSTPIVLVAATSSESGKTVLAGNLIQRLSDAGVRVGALKVTGTGGVLDSLHHQKSGAVAVLDSVDTGLITTNCDAEKFRQKIPLIFRQIESFNVDVIVAELGGDILCANNPEIFSIEELMDNTLLLLVISNDALAAAGVNAINEARLGFSTDRMRHFTSPFRNHAGMARRMASIGIPDCHDPRSPDDLKSTADQIICEVARDLQNDRENQT
jgi:Ni2+-binding GTPase involved in maturation of urease and hydrogenase